MKHLLWILAAIALMPSHARAQAMPDTPEPVNSDTSGWNQVADLARDEEIVVSRAGRFALRCRFDGATRD